MKKIILIAFIVLPSLSFASSYECTGKSFDIFASTRPVTLNIQGNGFRDEDLINVRAIVAFDTIVKGTSSKQAATVKLTIKEGANSTLHISSPAGIKEYTELTCVRK